jgi:hypothetical protein
MMTGRGFGGRLGKRSIMSLRGGGGGGGITFLMTVVGTDFGRLGGFSRMITGDGVRGGGGR